MLLFDYKLVFAQLGYLSVGALYTIGITILSIFFAALIGTVICYGRMAKNWFIFFIASAYVDIMRGIPLLVFLMWFFFGVPILLEADIPPLFAGVACLSLKYSGYLAETIRAGIQAIDKGQTEAALTLGYSKLQNLIRIIAPQSFRIVLPPIGNSFVSMLQDSSIVMVIGVWELMRRGESLANNTIKPFEIYTTVGIMYLILTVVFSRINRLIEKKTKIAQ